MKSDIFSLVCYSRRTWPLAILHLPTCSTYYILEIHGRAFSGRQCEFIFLTLCSLSDSTFVFRFCLLLYVQIGNAVRPRRNRKGTHIPITRNSSTSDSTNKPLTLIRRSVMNKWDFSLQEELTGTLLFMIERGVKRPRQQRWCRSLGRVS